MREESQTDDLRDVLGMFDALAQQLDDLLDLHAADGTGQEVARRLTKAKSIACRASERIREHLGGSGG